MIPLYRFHQWQANLRILDNRELKTVPYVPTSHPFIERLIGTIGRECLNQLLFWTASDLELKLTDFKEYYNRYRTHSAIGGQPPIGAAQFGSADLKSYGWRKLVMGYISDTNRRIMGIRQGQDTNRLGSNARVHATAASQIFPAVAEELNFTRAAACLHTSQPSLSQQIRQLEAAVGVRLLERSRQHHAFLSSHVHSV